MTHLGTSIAAFYRLIRQKSALIGGHIIRRCTHSNVFLIWIIGGERDIITASWLEAGTNSSPTQLGGRVNNQLSFPPGKLVAVVVVGEGGG